MLLSRDLLIKVLEQNCQEPAGVVADRIIQAEARVANIKGQLELLRKEKDHARTEFEEEVQRCEEAEVKLQQECDHNFSGANNCKICGIHIGAVNDSDGE